MEATKYIAQAAEMPRISTETAETVNVSAEGEKAAERAENKPETTQAGNYTAEPCKLAQTA